jgi:hypothetical protein
MQPRTQRLTGTVERKRIAPGSKSDHEGVVLRTDRGGEYILRRSGGNPFRDEALEQLVGKKITGEGFVTDHTFIMKDWKEKSGA